MSKEIKKPTTYQEQEDKLRGRNCIIEDSSNCQNILAAINYYRLTAYFLPFKQRDNTYRDGTSFEKVYHIYEFDRRLRTVLFAAVEECEVFLRARLAYFHAHKYGATGYLDPANFGKCHNHKKFSEELGREIYNNRKVPFVRHHIENYDEIFPIWVAVELFSFGMLSRFYSDMPRHDKRQISEQCFCTTYQNVESWLRCCTDLRNICAHYGRLYYRKFSAIPAGIDVPKEDERSLWACILALKALYPQAGKWNNEIVPAISALVEEYSAFINLAHISFPPDWKAVLNKDAMPKQ